MAKHLACFLTCDALNFSMLSGIQYSSLMQLHVFPICNFRLTFLWSINYLEHIVSVLFRRRFQEKCRFLQR